MSKKFLIIFFLVFIGLILFGFLGQKCPEEILNTTEILGKGIVNVEGRDYSYELLRLEGEERPSYAIYIENQKPEVIIIARPYAQISWSCEEVDKNQKDYVGIEEIAEDSNLYLYNNFSVLNVFGRFYDGGNIENDISDMVAGLNFLGGRDVGITGASWGGFEAIYAAAKSENKPLAGAAFYPPTDIGAWINWTYSRQDDFFQPHQERCQNATEGDYSNWSYEYLKENLETNFLIYHSYEDDLVPVEQTIKLTEMIDEVSSFLSHKEKANLTHGLTESSIYPLEYTILPIYLMRALTNDTITLILDLNELEGLEEEFVWEILLDDNLILLNVPDGRVISREELLNIYD